MSAQDSPRPVRVMTYGTLDLASADSYRRDLFTLIDHGSPRLILDMAALEFCDSQGLRALVEAADHAEAAHGSVAIANPGPQLRRILEITQLAERFAPRDSSGRPSPRTEIFGPVR